MDLSIISEIELNYSKSEKQPGLDFNFKAKIQIDSNQQIDLGDNVVALHELVYFVRDTPGLLRKLRMEIENINETGKRKATDKVLAKYEMVFGIGSPLIDKVKAFQSSLISVELLRNIPETEFVGEVTREQVSELLALSATTVTPYHQLRPTFLFDHEYSV